ncbi:TPA: hypothetical protein ACG0AV_003709, partial [Elizabethkingia anophelis]
EDWDFLTTLCYIDFFNDKINLRIETFLNKLINADDPIGERLWELLMILSEFEPKIKFQNFNFLYNFINDAYDEDTLKKLLDFVDENDIEDENILMQIDTLLDKYLRRILDSNDLDIDYAKHINQTYSYYEGYPEIDVDINGIEDDIRDNLNSFLDGFNINVLEKISFSTSNIVSDIDVDSKVTSYLESYEPEYDRDAHGGYFSGGSGGDDIDAIFER